MRVQRHPWLGADWCSQLIPLIDPWLTPDRYSINTLADTSFDTLSTSWLTVSWESTNFRFMHMSQSTLSQALTDFWSTAYWVLEYWSGCSLSVDWDDSWLLIEMLSGRFSRYWLNVDRDVDQGNRLTPDCRCLQYTCSLSPIMSSRCQGWTIWFLRGVRVIKYRHARIYF